MPVVIDYVLKMLVSYLWVVDHPNQTASFVPSLAKQKQCVDTRFDLFILLIAESINDVPLFLGRHPVFDNVL